LILHDKGARDEIKQCLIKPAGLDEHALASAKPVRGSQDFTCPIGLYIESYSPESTATRRGRFQFPERFRSLAEN
jgi:hypothetical protein